MPLLGGIAFGGIVLGGGSAAAWAEDAAVPAPSATANAPAPPPAPAPAPQPAPAPTPTPVPALAITSPTDRAFSQTNAVAFTGTMTAGSSVSIAAGSAECIATATDPTATDWGCTVVLPNGPNLVVTATETLEDGTAGDASTVSLDVLGPPTINAVPAQESPGVASGTAYKDSTISLLVNDTAQSCTGIVTDSGEWLCTIAGGPGTYKVKAVQSIASGTSLPSREVIIVVNPTPPVETPAPVIPPPAPQPIPAPPQPSPSPPAEEPAPSPSPTPSERADAGTLPWLDRPIFPESGGEGPTIREALTNWGSPTGFGSKLPTPGETVIGGNWGWAPLLALAFIALVAIPLRLLAGVLRGRFTFRSPRLAGRNRGSTTIAEPVPRNPWLMGVVPLAATAGLIVLAEGLNGEVRYMRLLFAVGAALAILNVVGVAIATRFASQRLGVSGRLRFLPILLVIAAIATLIARLTGMEPPLVGGVLIATGFAMTVPVKSRALVNLSQVGGVLTLALVAWVVHSLIGPVDGFWASVLMETLATVCLAGLGSALMLMLPIGRLPGRVVLEWSRGVWFGATALVATVTAAILMGGVQPAFPTLAAVLVVAGFAATSIAVWAWSNYAQVSRA